MIRVLLVLKETFKLFPRWLHNLHFPQWWVRESSCGSTFLPSFGIVSVLDLGHSNIWIIISDYWFNLPFPEDIWCTVSFHMVICHMYLFGDMSIKVFGPFLKSGCSFSYCWVLRVLCTLQIIIVFYLAVSFAKTFLPVSGLSHSCFPRA